MAKGIVEGLDVQRAAAIDPARRGGLCRMRLKELLEIFHSKKASWQGSVGSRGPQWPQDEVRISRFDLAVQDLPVNIKLPQKGGWDFTLAAQRRSTPYNKV